MKIAVEEISPVKKAITVEIPEEVVSQELKSAYTDLNRRVRIPGFRPGKAPKALLEKKYSGSVQDDVIRRLVPDYCQRAIKEAKLSPVELPSIENVQLKENTPLTFKATVEIKPAFELKDYSGLKVSVEKLELKDADVDRALESLRQKQAVLEARPADHAAEKNEFVLIDFEGRIGGKLFEGGSGQGVMIELGSNSFVPGFEDQIIGHKTGEQVEVTVTFPEDYPSKDLAGKEASFQVTLREIKNRTLPELDDEFAKDLGEYSSIDQLKKKIREDLDVQLKKEQEHLQRQALMKQLVELHPFELPPSLVEREVRSMLSQLQSRLPQGTSLEQAQIDPQFVQKNLHPAARAKVKGWLILEAIAEREGIEVSKSDLDEALGKAARDVKVPLEDLKRLIISREGSLDGFSQRLREDKAQSLVHSKTRFE